MNSSTEPSYLRQLSEALDSIYLLSRAAALAAPYLPRELLVDWLLDGLKADWKVLPLAESAPVIIDAGFQPVGLVLDPTQLPYGLRLGGGVQSLLPMSWPTNPEAYQLLVDWTKRREVALAITHPV